MADAPQNSKGEGVQSTCAGCGAALKMGWSQSTPKRAMLMPCTVCETKAAAMRCPTCGGTGRAPEGTKTGSAPEAA